MSLKQELAELRHEVRFLRNYLERLERDIAQPARPYVRLAKRTSEPFGRQATIEFLTPGEESRNSNPTSATKLEEPNVIAMQFGNSWWYCDCAEPLAAATRWPCEDTFEGVQQGLKLSITGVTGGPSGLAAVLNAEHELDQNLSNTELGECVFGKEIVHNGITYLLTLAISELQYTFRFKTNAHTATDGTIIKFTEWRYTAKDIFGSVGAAGPIPTAGGKVDADAGYGNSSTDAFPFTDLGGTSIEWWMPDFSPAIKWLPGMPTGAPSEKKVTSSTYTVTQYDKVLLADATSNDVTINLPAAADRDVRDPVIVVRVDSGGNTVTIDGDGSETINGAATKVLTTQYQAVHLRSSGFAWYDLIDQFGAEVTWDGETFQTAHTFGATGGVEFTGLSLATVNAAGTGAVGFGSTCTTEHTTGTVTVAEGYFGGYKANSDGAVTLAYGINADAAVNDGFTPTISEFYGIIGTTDVQDGTITTAAASVYGPNPTVDTGSAGVAVGGMFDELLVLDDQKLYVGGTKSAVGDCYFVYDSVAATLDCFAGNTEIWNASANTFQGMAANWAIRGNTPQAISAAYTPTNVTTDRAYDANGTTVAELADVLGTLIADLQSQGVIG